MQYKVIKTCAGFRGAYWEEGTIVEIDPKENPPYHFQPLEEIKPVEKKPVDPMAPVEVAPGKVAKSRGGFAHTVNRNVLGRHLTTDKVPNGLEQPEQPKKTRRKKKGVGSAKKSS